MKNSTFTTILDAAQNADLIDVVEFAELFEDLDYSKAEVSNVLLVRAFHNNGANPAAYEEIRNAYNSYLKTFA